MSARELSFARPLPASDGLVAGEHGKTWWSQRFLELLESFGVGSRLERGHGYARGGQVTELDVEPGIVLARVQGTRYTPYRVRIRASLLSEQQWRRAERAIAAQALPLAQLLAGTMPPDIEELLAGCKLSLFPASYAELKASCECPDNENPCKHIAAVYYLLAERFDADPLLIFTWRGRTQEELLAGLRARRAKTRRLVAVPPAREATAADGAQEQPFWRGGAELAELRVSPFASEAPDALLRRLGAAPAEVGGDLADRLAAIYAQLAEAAERRALSG
ncbi:MAG TPA: SWIM zinc finger family protein [Solirubrobacteraceae bacterium]|nr:SWIM zinc finger family protein [Solirubrobacteraceae bacterium]